MFSHAFVFKLIQQTVISPRIILVPIICLGLAGCINLQPVEPWQRGNLARDVMLKNTHGSQAAFEEHVYSSKEGTAGGYGLGAGGCGCN